MTDLEFNLKMMQIAGKLLDKVEQLNAKGGMSTVAALAVLEVAKTIREATIK